MNAPIGIFDSGVGGISVCKEIRKALPRECCLFLGDSARAPYGVRPEGEVLAFTREGLRYLRERGCKAAVIACNTATAVAADVLRRENPDFPIVAIEPAVKPAVEAHPTGKILLMATPLTLRSARLQNLVERVKGEAEVHFLPCPGLVELIEEGHWEDEALFSYLTSLFAPLSFRPDALVLGCTHYPHVSAALSRHFDGIPQYHGGSGAARRLAYLLEKENLLSDSQSPGTVSFRFTCGDPRKAELARRLLSRP